MSEAAMLVLSIMLLSWVAAVAVTSGVAVFRARRRRGAHPVEASTSTPAADLPAIVVVRPCAGLEPHLDRSLRSTAALRYRGPLRVVFTTSTHDDPARPLAEEVAQWLGAWSIDARVQTVTPRGTNLKASQLAGIIDDAPEAIALCIDSDVQLQPIDLERLVAPLVEQPRPCAAVWCPPVEREPTERGDRLSAAVLGGSLHAFPLLGTLDPHGLVGKTFAIRTDALRSVGGFSSLVQHLGEDMELARRLRQADERVVMSPVVIESLANGRSATQVLERYVRWLMVIRAQRPALLASYPLLLAATPLLVLASAGGLLASLPGAGVALGIAVSSRVLVAAAARQLASRPRWLRALLFDAVGADLLLLAAFARASFGPARVRWRERSLRLGAHGRLEAG